MAHLAESPRRAVRTRSPSWIATGGTPICVLAAAQILRASGAAAVAETRPRSPPGQLPGECRPTA
ncbi:MAG: hypothetical protein ACRDOK_28535 [Streptosporangiaceae bacterium]